MPNDDTSDGGHGVVMVSGVQFYREIVTCGGFALGVVGFVELGHAWMR